MDARYLRVILAALAFAVPCAAGAASDGSKLFEERCSGCHNPNRLPLDDKHMTRAEWKENVDRMVDNGNIDPKLSKDEYAALLDWLAATHGPSGAERR